MSTLIVQLPPRPRHEGAAPLRAPSTWRYVWTAHGKQVDGSGVAATDLLPKSDSLVAVVNAADVGWQRLTLPRAPGTRMRAALAGATEDLLLEDAETLHFALPPRAQAGGQSWVAVAHMPWLKCLLDALEASGRNVERLVPEHSPAGEITAPVTGHFRSATQAPEADDAQASEAADAHPLLLLSGPAGACQLQLAGTMAAALLRKQLGASSVAAGVATNADAMRWTAAPNAAAAAEAWLDQHGHAVRVDLRTDGQHLLAALGSAWNLRQFDLLPQLRGTRAVRDALRRLASPQWRALRWGAAALVGLQLVGLNTYAWQQSRAVQAQRTQAIELLKATHPQIRAVLDVPLQMQRETELLRQAAGRPAPGDLETLIAASAMAWPQGLASAQSLRFDNGQLQITVPGASEAHAASLSERLRAQGLEARFNDNRLVVQRAAMPR